VRASHSQQKRLPDTVTTMPDLDPLHYQPATRLLSERVVLVTGASSGIGERAALAFAAHGATVILHGRDMERLERVYDQIVASGAATPAILPLDFANATERDFDNLEQSVRAQLGRLDGILHNAAHFAPLTALENQRLDEWLRLLRVNLAAPFALTRACLALLRAAPDASVVVTGETHGLHPGAYWGGFAVAKSGLTAYARIQADEWSSMPSLRINLVVPGRVDSPCRARTHPGEARTSRASIDSLMPLYLYLMGPDSRGVSGQVFEADELRGRR
jgi:NAD(P)-dependent dehydrogenase (short-subunit alcohol dehydrogenase family)